MSDVTEIPGFHELSDRDQDALIAFEQTLQRSWPGRLSLDTYFDGDLHLIAPQIQDRTEYDVDERGALAVAPTRKEPRS